MSADPPKKRRRTPIPSPRLKSSTHRGKEPIVPTVATKKMEFDAFRIANPANTEVDTSQLETDGSAEMQLDTTNIREIFDKMLIVPNKGIKAYDEERKELLAQEKANAWDRKARPEDPSTPEAQEEKRAADIILALREYERRIVFGNMPSEAIPGPETLDMGGQFLTNKERIENHSMVYQIASEVPKGALLHLHFNAELSPDLLLKQAREMDRMYIRSIFPILNEDDLARTEMVFSILGPEDVDEEADIFSPRYPGTALNWKQPDWKKKIWMKWRDFQEKFSEKFPEHKAQKPTFAAATTAKRICCAAPLVEELSPAEAWLKSKMVLSLDEAYGPDQTVNGVWARFNQATRAFKGLLNYESVYEWYIFRAIDRLIEEKVMYAELRPMLLDKAIPNDNGTDKVNISGQMKLIIKCVKAKQDELSRNKELHKFPFGLKIVYCTPRSIPKKMMQEEMKHCIELKEEFPDLICGFDLVGAEDRPNHIGFYKEELVAFKETCKAKGLNIPFLFHAGETLLDTGGSADPENSNLYDAAVLKAERIGHGFSLMKHPEMVIDRFRKTDTSRGICVELCPISNELLHLCRNVKEHPFPELLAAGIPCTINSDNPSLFQNSMPFEFYQVMVGAPTMTLYSWKQLARWSIDYSYLSDTQKEEAHVHLNKSWVEFCKTVVDKFGDLVDEEGNTMEKQAAAAYAKMPGPPSETKVPVVDAN